MGPISSTVQCTLILTFGHSVRSPFFWQSRSYLLCKDLSIELSIFLPGYPSIDWFIYFCTHLSTFYVTTPYSSLLSAYLEAQYLCRYSMNPRANQGLFTIPSAPTPSNQYSQIYSVQPLLRHIKLHHCLT